MIAPNFQSLRAQMQARCRSSRGGKKARMFQTRKLCPITISRRHGLVITTLPFPKLPKPPTPKGIRETMVRNRVEYPVTHVVQEIKPSFPRDSLETLITNRVPHVFNL